MGSGGIRWVSGNWKEQGREVCHRQPDQWLACANREKATLSGVSLPPPHSPAPPPPPPDLQDLTVPGDSELSGVILTPAPIFLG